MAKLDEYLNNIQEIDPVTMTGAMMALSAASLIVSATKLYKDYFTKAARQCSDLSPQDKALCLLRSKQLAKNVQLKSLQSSLGKCAKAKDGEKCKTKVSAKIAKLNGEIKFLKQRYDAIAKLKPKK